MRIHTRRQWHLYGNAIKAAIRRTRPGLSPIEFELAIQMTLKEIRIDARGHLSWRGCALGRRLFVCLSEAQNWRCCYCGVRTLMHGHAHPRLATLEHIVPKCLGGDDHPDNLAMACAGCNSSRCARVNRHLDASGKAPRNMIEVLKARYLVEVGWS